MRSPVQSGWVQRFCRWVLPRYLPQEEDKVSHSVDGRHSQGVLHQDDEGVARRGAEAGAVDCGCSVSVLKRAATGKRFASVPTPALPLDRSEDTHLIQVGETLLQAPQTADTGFEHAASAGVLLEMGGVKWIRI